MKPTFAILLAGLTSIIGAEAVEPRVIRGKRGLAFGKAANNPVNRGRPGAEYTHYFKGYDQISWIYDWEGVIDGEAIDLEYVPMLRDDQLVFTQGWSEAVAFAQRHYRSKHVLSFNEPDHCGGGGACMDVARAVKAHRDHLEPFAVHGLKVGSPAVTSGSEPGKGIDWLKDFMASCSDCQIDFIAAHWYAWDEPEAFKTYMINLHEAFNKPIWITELGVTEGDADAFLQAVLPWMDQQDWIERYAYHMVAPRTESDQFLISASGTRLSLTGCVYATT